MLIYTYLKQKDMVSRKEMERQKSMKEFKSDIQEKEEDLVSMEKIIVDLEAQLSMSEENRKTMEGDHEQVGILRKKIEELEQMVQKSEATEKNKVSISVFFFVVNLYIYSLFEMEYFVYVGSGRAEKG